MGKYDLFTLHLFAAVVDHKNIAHAARTNHIAGSAVSKRISELEARLSVQLLYRQREGVEATAAGLVVYRYAKQIRQVVSTLDRELSSYTEGLRGEVRIWANTSAVTQFLSDDLATYVHDHPEVCIRLREDVSNKIADAVRDGSADLGIFSEHVGQNSLATRIYRRDTLMLLVPEGHVLASCDTVSLRDTLDYQHIALQHGSSLRARILAAADADGHAMKIRVDVYGFDGIRAMVEAGLGVSVLPQGAVLPFLSGRGLAAIPLAEPWADRALLLGFRDYEMLPTPARALVDHLAPEITLSPL